MTPKQRKFCRCYLESLNATEAAKKSGYSQDDNVAGVQGHRLLRNAKIQAHISERINATLGGDIPGLKAKVIKALEGEAFLGSASNKIKALELLAKYLRLWDNNVNLNLGIREDQKETIAFLTKHGLADRT